MPSQPNRHIERQQFSLAALSVAPHVSFQLALFVSLSLVSIYIYILCCSMVSMRFLISFYCCQHRNEREGRTQQRVVGEAMNERPTNSFSRVCVFVCVWHIALAVVAVPLCSIFPISLISPSSPYTHSAARPHTVVIWATIFFLAYISPSRFSYIFTDLFLSFCRD